MRVQSNNARNIWASIGFDNSPLCYRILRRRQRRKSDRDLRIKQRGRQRIKRGLAGCKHWSNVLSFDARGAYLSNHSLRTGRCHWRRRGHDVDGADRDTGMKQRGRQRNKRTLAGFIRRPQRYQTTRSGSCHSNPSSVGTGDADGVEKFVLSLLLCCAVVCERSRWVAQHVGWCRETAVGEPAYSKSNSYIAWYLEVTDTSYNWDSSLLEAKNRWRQEIKFVE